VTVTPRRASRYAKVAPAGPAPEIIALAMRSH